MRQLLAQVTDGQSQELAGHFHPRFQHGQAGDVVGVGR